MNESIDISEIELKYAQGWWHNGIDWHSIKCGIALNKQVLSNCQRHRRSLVRRLYRKNVNTIIVDSSKFDNAHIRIFDIWKSRFNFPYWREFIDGVLNQGFEFSDYIIDGTLAGYDIVLRLKYFVVHQLFVWDRDKYADRYLGKYALVVSILNDGAHRIHLFGKVDKYKTEYGGIYYATNAVPWRVPEYST